MKVRIACLLVALSLSGCSTVWNVVKAAQPYVPLAQLQGDAFALSAAAARRAEAAPAKELRTVAQLYDEGYLPDPFPGWSLWHKSGIFAYRLMNPEAAEVCQEITPEDKRLSCRPARDGDTWLLIDGRDYKAWLEEAVRASRL